MGHLSLNIGKKLEIQRIVNAIALMKRVLGEKTKLPDIETIHSFDSDAMIEITSYFHHLLDSGDSIPISFIYNRWLQGRSGSAIFYSGDFNYTIKTIRTSEFNVMNRLVKHFKAYERQNPDTLIVKYNRLYRIKRGDSITYFVIMKNLIHSPFSCVFDLKGKTFSRTIDSGVLTEKDWIIRLKVKDRNRVLQPLERDSSFLSSLNLMDYSLIVRIALPIHMSSISNGYELIN